MKKFIFVIMIIIFMAGCIQSKKVSEIKKSPQKKEEVTNDYNDSNNTPIGIYKLSGNTLQRIDTINITPVVEEDIGIFQIYPSNDDNIKLSKAFGLSFYDEWIKYPNIKMGFNIKFTLQNNEDVSYNFFNPDHTFDKWEYLMNYLYDDYNNFGKSFYSHMESDEFNDNSLITSIKLQSSYSVDQVVSPIKLTVFTYDTDDDFIDNEYRGNSFHTLTICINGREC